MAVIGTPAAAWISQRDVLLLALMYNTGARVSEVIGITVADVVLAPAACVHLHGKGRKQRSVPLWRSTVLVLRAWLRLNPDLGATPALLPNRDGQPMTRSNVTQRLALAVKAAAPTFWHCASTQTTRCWTSSRPCDYAQCEASAPKPRSQANTPPPLPECT